MEWTDKQKQVIEARGRNILVSAAAGSGKTAVLVERIIRKVTDKDNPIDIDKLLVVTFTKAAAAQMRERVLEALEKAAENEPDNDHLQRQQTYIHNAMITTIDSFCARMVREHFDAIDLDPNTRIVDSAQMKMLENDVMAEMLEEYYQSEDRNFLELANVSVEPDATGTMENMISVLYAASRSHVSPKKWLNDCKKAYEITKDSARKSDWYESLMKRCEDSVDELIDFADRALEISEMSGGPYAYIDDISLIRQALERMKGKSDYDGIRDALYDIHIGKAPIVRGKDVDQELKKKAKEYRDSLVNGIKSLKNDLLKQSFDELTDDVILGGKFMNTLVDLTLDFTERFSAAKKEKCVMDFNDEEHYALEILTELKDDGTTVPSAVAREISLQFEEIMIDEYQDSNYIQEAILTSVANGNGVNNVFMVGDVKQSIYKFRLANPNLFIEKYDTYSEDENADYRKIILDRNFRSRSEVIDSVNYIFHNLMHRDLGGIEYSDGNALDFGAEYYEKLPEGQDNRTEFMLVEGKGNENEARAIARRIKEFVGNQSGFMISGKNGMRRPDYRDIVILLRSISGYGDEYVKILEEEGVPAYCESKTGYYNASEVKTVLSYLSVIDNPYQDIPLAAVMRSKMYGFSSEELAEIRENSAEKYFYSCIKSYKGREVINGKIEKFLKDLNLYRKISAYTSVYDLITHILGNTGYLNYVSALPGGLRRSKNLDILKEKATTYDSGSYKGLFNFLRYIEKIQELGMDEGEASTVSENDNIVRIMSIHKSKGLQFPIVFVGRLNSDFNMRSLSEQIVTHEQYGAGIDVKNAAYKVKGSTAVKEFIKSVMKEEMYAENIRILYVALTRAQEKMILTASDALMEKKVVGWIEFSDRLLETVPRKYILQKNNFADWLGLAIAKNKGFSNVNHIIGKVSNLTNPSYYEESKIVAQYVSDIRTEEEAIKELIDYEDRKMMLARGDVSGEFMSGDLYAKLQRNFSWKYVHEQDAGIPAKVTVSELKRIMNVNSDEDGEEIWKGRDAKENAPVPRFVDDSDVVADSGVTRGNAYHKVFELFDFSMEATEENIRKMMKNLLDSNKISRNTYDAVGVRELLDFTRTDLYRRIKKAFENGNLYRERAFMMGIPANVLFPDKESDEMVLVQGVIDACFIEDGRYVIVDYKTDNVSSMEELLKRYSTQLKCYAWAVCRIDGTDVSEMIIYSVKYGREINVV